MLLEAKYLSGKTSKVFLVEVRFSESYLYFDLVNKKNSYALSDCKMQDSYKSAPDSIVLPGGEQLLFESKIPKQIKEKLKGSTHISIEWMRDNKRGMFLFTVFTLSFVLFLFQYAIPMLSKNIAFKIPYEALTDFDRRLLDSLDQQYMSPSELSIERQVEIRDFIRSYSQDDIRIEFRKMGMPNAFALSANTMIFTDEIVQLLDNKKMLLAIYYHEKGHLEERHVVQNLISSSIITVGISVFFGDLSGATETILGVGGALVNLNFSREFERRADQYAFEKLKEQKISPSCFGLGLKKIEETLGKLEKDSIWSYLSTHPNPTERIEQSYQGALKGECK